jgi:hypothetical protein
LLILDDKIVRNLVDFISHTHTSMGFINFSIKLDFDCWQAVVTDHLRDIRTKIINKCGGLPLAVKVMGGLLSTRPRSKHEWEAVLNHGAWSADGLREELDTRIYLSYEDTSPKR